MARRITEKQRTFTLRVYEAKEDPGPIYLSIYAVKSMAVASAAASRLLKNVKVEGLLAELQKKAEDASVAQVLERKQILTEIARGRLTDYTTCGPDGDLISVGPESPNTAALQEVTSRTEVIGEDVGQAVITKLKLHSPMTAIDLLNKMEKLYSDGTTVLVDNSDNRSVNIGAIDAKGQLIAELNRFAARIEAHRGDK